MTTLLSMSGVALRLLSTAATDAIVFLSGAAKDFGLTVWQLPCGRGAGSSWCPLHGVSANASPGGSTGVAMESVMKSALARTARRKSGNDDRLFTRLSMGPPPRRAPAAAHHSYAQAANR